MTDAFGTNIEALLKTLDEGLVSLRKIVAGLAADIAHREKRLETGIPAGE